MPNREAIAKKLSTVIGLGTLVVLTLSLSSLSRLISKSTTPSKTLAAPPAIRGIAGDAWADIVIGKRDFSEISAREIVSFKVNSPGGVVVDRNSTPNRAYIWDSGNNRILGLDLNRCYSNSTPCTADIVIGQPSLSDYGACNQDSSFQTFPDRPPSTASTLCGVPEWTHTTLEDKSFSSMYVDSSSALWVADSRNNRVLRYIDPFSPNSDQAADNLWGQPDFSGNKCNGNGFYTTVPNQPTDSSLCFFSIVSSGSGVSLDSSENMWVADGGNNRVLRFPLDPQTSLPAQTADLVLGQPNFTTGGDWSGGSSPNQMSSPNSVAVDAQGTVYVADTGNGRILKFSAPFSNGMAGTEFLTQLDYPTSIQLDSQNRGLWILTHFGGAKLYDLNGSLVSETGSTWSPTGGSIGQDNAGHLLISTYSYDTEVLRYAHSPTLNRYSSDLRLFFPPPGASLPGNNPRFYNLTSGRRLESLGLGGVAIAGNQLVVSDSRLLFWNSLSSLYNGKPADGFVGTNAVTNLPSPEYGKIKTDSNNRVWVTRGNEVWVYQAPLSTSSVPVKKIAGPLGVVGGGQVTLTSIHGIAPSADGQYLWISQPDSHRVFRIRDPLSASPLIDVILGQTSISGNQCNRGLIPTPNTGTNLTADLDMLCFPGALSTDKLGNLYVSDHTIEANGNFRLLMFTPDRFPATISAILAPSATKEFPRGSGTNPYGHATFEVAFDNANHMVAGHNPYLGPRFLDFYINPTQTNSNNPSDPLFAKPDTTLKDFYNWPAAMAFDQNNNLYAYDANRGQVRIYKGPLTLGLPITPAPSSTPPPPIPTSTPAPTSTPTPTPLPPITVSTNHVSVTLNLNNAVAGIVYGPGFTITSNSATGWNIISTPDASIANVGFYEYSGGINPGASTAIRTFAFTNKKPDGVYTGSGVVKYYKDGAWSTGPTVTYTITLVGSPTPTPIPTSTPIPTPTPTCTISASPSLITLPLGSPAASITAAIAISGQAAITRVDFGSYDTSIASVSTTQDTNPPYSTQVLSVSPGFTAVWARAYLTTGGTCVTSAGQDSDVEIALLPEADTYVDGEPSHKATNFGSRTTLQVDGSPQKITYLRYNLSPLSGKIISQASLRLKVTNGSTSSQRVKRVADTTWNEASITHNKRPSLGTVVTTFAGGTQTEVWKEIDITAAVLEKLGQKMSLAIDSGGSDGWDVYSKESAAGNQPLLIIR